LLVARVFIVYQTDTYLAGVSFMNLPDRKQLLALFLVLLMVFSPIGYVVVL